MDLSTTIDVDGNIWVDFNVLPDNHLKALSNIGDLSHMLDEVLSDQFTEKVKTELDKLSS